MSVFVSYGGEIEDALLCSVECQLVCRYLCVCFDVKDWACSPDGVIFSTTSVILRQQQVISELSRMLIAVLCGCGSVLWGV